MRRWAQDNPEDAKPVHLAPIALSRKEQEELSLIESNVSVDLASKRVTFRYPFIRDVNQLQDNRGQAIAIASKLEARFKLKHELHAYNLELQDFLQRGVLRNLTQHELESWTGPVNYISHHGVLKLSLIHI